MSFVAIRLSFFSSFLLRFLGIRSMVPGAITPMAKRITHPKLALLVSPLLRSAALVFFRIACDSPCRKFPGNGVLPICRLRLTLAAKNPVSFPMPAPILHVNIDLQVPGMEMQMRPGHVFSYPSVYHGRSRLPNILRYRNSSRQLEACEISMLSDIAT